MAVKFVSVKCPECGANLPMEEGREKKMFCSYCGAQILMTNENEYIYRHIDEAEVKQAETDKIIKLKKMEIAEKMREEAEKRKNFKITLSVIIGAIGVLNLFIGYAFGEEAFLVVGMICLIVIMYMWLLGSTDKDEIDVDLGDKVKVPSVISEYETKNYATIESVLLGAGFKNIKCIPINDLTTGLLKKPGTVESITIDGKEVTAGGKKFSCNALVVISYHSFAGK